MTIKTFGTISLVAIISCVVIATYNTFVDNSSVIIRATNNAFTCANINFGSNAQAGVFMPSTLKAYTFDVNTISATKLFEKYISDYQGITISDFTITKCFYNTADTRHYAIKIGTNGIIGNLTLNFNEMICGCSVYALSYQNENAIMVVNNIETTLLSYAPTLKKTTAEELDYDRYDYTFAPTHTLEIKSKYGRVDMLSRARFYVCNIVLRVVV